MCTLSLITYIYIQIYICLYVWKKNDAICSFGDRS